MTVQVLTVKGQPTFEVPNCSAQEIDKLVERRYGCQTSSLPHNWQGG